MTMSKAKHIDYDATTSASLLAGESKDCAIRAVAIATRQNYDFVRGIFQGVGREPNSPTPWPFTLAVLRILKYTTESLPLDEFRGRRVDTLSRELDKTGVFLLRVKEHVLCVYRGKIEDDKSYKCEKVLGVRRLKKKKCSKCGSEVSTLYYNPPDDWDKVPKIMQAHIISSYDVCSCVDIHRQAQLCIACATALWHCAEIHYLHIPHD